MGLPSAGEEVTAMVQIQQAAALGPAGGRGGGDRWAGQGCGSNGGTEWGS